MLVLLIATSFLSHSKPNIAERLLPKKADGDADQDEFDQLKQQKDDIDTILSVKCIGILCHIIQNSKGINLSAITRLTDQHDMPLFLTGLIEHNPWILQTGSGEYKFCNGEWKWIPPEDHLQLTQTEGQLWIALHQMLLNPDYANKYYLDDYRKTRLMRLLPLISETLTDQLPVLSHVQRYLHSLSLMQTPAPKNGLILEQVSTDYIGSGIFN